MAETALTGLADPTLLEEPEPTAETPETVDYLGRRVPVAFKERAALPVAGPAVKSATGGTTPAAKTTRASSGTDDTTAAKAAAGTLPLGWISLGLKSADLLRKLLESDPGARRDEQAYQQQRAGERQDFTKTSPTSEIEPGLAAAVSEATKGIAGEPLDLGTLTKTLTPEGGGGPLPELMYDPTTGTWRPIAPEGAPSGVTPFVPPPSGDAELGPELGASLEGASGATPSAFSQWLYSLKNVGGEAIFSPTGLTAAGGAAAVPSLALSAFELGFGEGPTSGNRLVDTALGVAGGVGDLFAPGVGTAAAVVVEEVFNRLGVGEHSADWYSFSDRLGTTVGVEDQALYDLYVALKAAETTGDVTQDVGYFQESVRRVLPDYTVGDWALAYLPGATGSKHEGGLTRDYGKDVDLFNQTLADLKAVLPAGGPSATLSYPAFRTGQHEGDYEAQVLSDAVRLGQTTNPVTDEPITADYLRGYGATPDQIAQWRAASMAATSVPVPAGGDGAGGGAGGGDGGGDGGGGE